MAWIRTIDERDAQGRLEALYRDFRDPGSRRVDNILKVHSLNDDSLHAHCTIYTASMKGTHGLPKVDREMIAVVVSQRNRCTY